MFVVILQYLGKYGERRVVHHNAAVRVGIAFIVAARVERPHEASALHSVLVGHPCRHSLVHLHGRVAVVRGLGRLELGEEIAVLVVFGHVVGPLHLVLEALPFLRHAHPPLLQLRCVPVADYHLPVILAERQVVLYGVLAQLGWVGVGWQHLARKRGHTHRLRRLKPLVSRNHHVAIAVRNHDQLAQAQHLGRVLHRLFQFLKIFLADFPWVARQAFHFTVVRPQITDCYFSCFNVHIYSCFDRKNTLFPYTRRKITKITLYNKNSVMIKK